MPLRFKVNYKNPRLDYAPLIQEVVDELQTPFIEMPRGSGFVDYVVFEQGYQALKRTTDAFRNVTPTTVMLAMADVSIVFVVFRSILGFSPGEWAQVTCEETDVVLTETVASNFDRTARMKPLEPWRATPAQNARVLAMFEAGIRTLARGTGVVPPGVLHRLDKVDTHAGFASMQSIADMGSPYAILLYERFLGRPFATHRDSVSSLVGEILEVAIKNTLTEAKVSYRETTRVEKIPGYDQRPDFFIPDEFAPVALIEAKLAQDPGTVRDKVTRVRHLRTQRDQKKATYDIIACIAGRGFKVRPEDMRRMLEATNGKVFTLASMHLLIDQTQISKYRVR